MACSQCTTVYHSVPRAWAWCMVYRAYNRVVLYTLYTHYTHAIRSRPPNPYMLDEDLTQLRCYT